MKPTRMLLHATLALAATVAALEPPAPPAKPSSMLAAEGRDAIPDIPDLQDVDSEAEASDTKMLAAAGGAGAAAAHGHGKFFQYGHHDGKDHYENGFRRGNEHHFHERHEKGAPKHGHFTTKVRWGDKHGGYGEHYWDYNHGGHHDGGDGGDGGGGGGGEGSAPIPDILEHPDDERRPQFKRQSAFDQAGAASTTGAESPPGRSRAYRKKYVRPTTTPATPTHPVPKARTTPRPQPYRQPPPPPTAGTGAPMHARNTKSAAFFTPDFPPGGMFQSAAAAAGLGPRAARQTQTEGSTAQAHAAKAQPKGPAKGQPSGQTKLQPNGPPKGQGAPGPGQVAAALVRRLAFDPRTGRVHDEDTGQVFVLQPVS
ncbi:POU domain, class 3, transcription factor 2-like isoform X2 [Frankliniella occidentalis]|uniref:POU domain, class 3, transcription factor 2-like isoform X2 n=1 Tax=Frankliniella occidentalis TaxID=133901 RepID=A0A9C6XBB5_FRAOC|nr:POU domain, class 3, transcription factor 2-like isoform X2 [Frankliniella occidentalis]